MADARRDALKPYSWDRNGMRQDSDGNFVYTLEAKNKIDELRRRLTKAENAERALRQAVSEVGATGGASWGAHYADKIRKRAVEILADIEKGK